MQSQERNCLKWSTKRHSRLPKILPCVHHPCPGAERAPLIVGKLPKGGARAHFQDVLFHEGSQQGACHRHSNSMSHDGLDMLDGLGCCWVMHFVSLNIV